MALRYYSNAPATTLAASCTAVATTIEVTSTTGFPIQYPFTLIIDKDENSEEAVSVTNASGNELTVTRGHDSTTAFSHANGATVVHGITALDIREANAHVNETGDVHGLGSDIVGVSDVQTLSGKTMDVDNNTIGGFTADAFARANASGVLDQASGVSGEFVLNPTGVIQMYGGVTTPPDGWLFCDGSAVSRTTYADLFAVVGTSFGVGDGSTTFNLPDLANNFARGAASTGTVGGTGGSSTHTLTVGQLPSHDHGAGSLATSSSGGHVHDLRRSNGTGGGSELARGTNSIDVTNSIPINSDGSHTHNITGTTGNTGSGNSFSLLNPYVQLNFIIKT